MEIPPGLNADTLSRAFMSLATERYPSADKVKQKVIQMGITDPRAQIIVIEQFRDATREVALGKIFKSVQHRDEFFLAIIEALEDLEDEVENLLDESAAARRQDEKVKE